MHPRSFLTVFATVVCATAANAEESTSNKDIATSLSVTAGVVATTRLNASDGLEHVENEVEAFVEAEFGSGFHTGVTLTSLYDNPADTFEYELTFGYGRDFGNEMSWDLTYGYIGLNSSDDYAQEITASLGFPIGESVEGSFAVIYDPDTGKSDQEIGFDTDLTERWTLFGLAGNSDRDDNVYAEIGVSYALNESFALELLLEDTNDGDALLGFSIGYEFGS